MAHSGRGTPLAEPGAAGAPAGDRLEAELRRIDRLAALGALAAEAAHEVRNPLVSVKTFLQLLPERHSDVEFLTRFAAVAGEELRRVERLLDLVVEYSGPGPRSGAGGGAPTGALEAVAALLGPRARSRGVELVVEATAELPEVELGEDALRQVLLNLALNAIDASPRGGCVRLGGRATRDAVEIRVSDAGPGIPRELRARVFEPFFSTRDDRAGGLGLAISQRIAAEAGGSIEVGDAEGGGAELRVRLPVSRKG